MIREGKCGGVFKFLCGEGFEERDCFAFGGRYQCDFEYREVQAGEVQDGTEKKSSEGKWLSS